MIPIDFSLRLEHYFHHGLSIWEIVAMSIKKTANTKEIFKASFSNVISAGVDNNDFNLLRTGAGQTVSQSAGNLVLAAGTTANSETVIRSRKAFRGNIDLRYSAILSQRIANNNFFIELVDVIGDNLPFSCGSATALTVTFPSANDNPFYDAAIPNKSVGQSVYLGNFQSTAANVLTPGRYAIASVTATTVTFTVVGFTSGATGTLSAFGWNYHHVLYDGTVATNAKYDSQRNGWATGDTTMTINTTASPGHVGVLTVEDGNTAYQDQLAASATGLQSTVRASRVTTIPDYDVQLFLQIRSANGSTAPASGTTFTIGFVSVEEIIVETVTLNGVRPQALQSALPVAITGGGNGLTSLVQVGGQQSVNAAPNGAPVRVGVVGLTTNQAVVTPGNVQNLTADVHGRPVVQLGNVPNLQDQNRITLTTTTETTLIAAVASVRHGVHGLVVANRDTVATTVDFRDTTAGTIRHSVVIPAGVTQFIPFDFGWWQSAVNTNFTAALRAAITTNAVEISALSFRVAY